MALANPKIYWEPHDVHNQLAHLGLEEDWLLNAARVGQLQRANCTPHHPPSFPALSAWAETIKTARDILVPEGWLIDNPRGLPIVYHHNRKIAITVATGDDATGNREFDPCTKCPKGPQMKSNISNNQLKLFPNEELAIAAYEQTAKTGIVTWLLLIHSDEVKRELRCELSLPIGMNQEGRVDGWAKRIILGSTPFDADTLKVPNDDIPQSPNITVNVKRRA
ncbi:MAG TPA: hypothetical protein VFA76_12820 [Terriglobales bacterium]|nr:hypothetical protein [Terriglobales bacterium]